jgi:hypothetical protein
MQKNLCNHKVSICVEKSHVCTNVDLCLLKQNRVRKRAMDFLIYAKHHKLIRRIEKYKWELTLDTTTIQVRPKEVGYDQSSLVNAWKELQEIQSV